MFAGCAGKDDGLHGTPLVCTPGVQSACDCGAGVAGMQRCASDGKRWETCQCPPPPPDLAVPADLAMPPPDLAMPRDLAAPLPAPKAYWKLDEPAGATTAIDSVGGFNGTVSNGQFMAGKIGNGFAGNGSSAYIDIGNPAGLQLTGAMTISAWIYVVSVANNGRIISKGGGPGMRGWSLNVESTGILRFMVALDTSNNIAVDTPAAITLGQWIHAVGVYEPSVALRLYLNGVLTSSNTTGVPAAQFNQALNINLARRTDGTYYDGRLDDVRIYDQALTATQVTGLFKF